MVLSVLRRDLSASSAFSISAVCAFSKLVVSLNDGLKPGKGEGVSDTLPSQY